VERQYLKGILRSVHCQGQEGSEGASKDTGDNTAQQTIKADEYRVRRDRKERA
jgi:hypothetical protein